MLLSVTVGALPVYGGDVGVGVGVGDGGTAAVAVDVGAFAMGVSVAGAGGDGAGVSVGGTEVSVTAGVSVGSAVSVAGAGGDGVGVSVGGTGVSVAVGVGVASGFGLMTSVQAVFISRMAIKFKEKEIRLMVGMSAVFNHYSDLGGVIPAFAGIYRFCCGYRIIPFGNFRYDTKNR